MNQILAANAIIKAIPKDLTDTKWTHKIQDVIYDAYSMSTAPDRVNNIIQASARLAEALKILPTHPDMRRVLYMGSPKALAKDIASMPDLGRDDVLSGLTLLVEHGRAVVVGKGQGRFVVILTSRLMYDPVSESDVNELLSTVADKINDRGTE